MTMTDRIADLSMLWKQASMIFPYFDQRKIDWDEAYREYLQKVLQAKTDREFHLLLAEFMNLLGDGHTDYLFPEALRDETGYIPFSLRWMGDAYVVDGAAAEYEAYVGGQVLSINEIPFGELIREVKRYSYHVGDYVSRYRLHQVLPFFLKPTQNMMETSKGQVTFDLLHTRPSGFAAKELQIPDSFRSLKNGKLDIRLYRDGILFVRLDDFMYSDAAEEIQRAIGEHPEIKGILFDLRENVGGMTMYGAKIAQLLISGTFHGCQKRTRSMTGVGLASASQIVRWSEEAIEKHIASGLSTREEIEESKSFVTNTHYDRYADTYGAQTHRALFDGPCMILTSRHTVSAAEDFVAMFRTNHRALILGTETCGTTGTPYMQQLSCGGWMRVCSVGYQLMDGTEFVGCGIKPDIHCQITADEYADGYDAVLKKGLDHIRSQL